MRAFTILVIIPFVAAANDWTKPCTKGWCSYESGDGKTSAWSNLVINADNTKVLSDITTAAGWQILNCDAKSKDPQDIRLVCVDKSKGCDKLFEGGAENTIVRLPESCAGGPFARVSKAWIHQDQSIPIAHTKRDTADPVRGLRLDFDFSQIPQSKGKVYITASATNSAVQRDALSTAAVKRSLVPFRHANRRDLAATTIAEFVEKRGFFDKIVQGVKGAGNTVINGTKDLINKVTGGTSKAGQTIGQILDTATGKILEGVNSLDDATRFNEDFKKNFNVVKLNKKVTIVDKRRSCPAKGSIPALDAGIKVTADVRTNLGAAVGFIVTGSIVPPKIDDVAFTGALTGDVDAIFAIVANAKGTVSTPDFELFNVGLPGLSFPGILTVGPSISANANAKATLGVTADVTVGASFKVPKMEFVFPPNKGSSTAIANPKSVPVKLDVGASAALTGRAEAHIIPRLNIGVDLLKGTAKATVFANIDGFAALDFGLTAKVQAVPIVINVGGSKVTSTEVKLQSATVGGNVGMDVGVSINVGADAKLATFFNPSTKLTLFSKKFDVFDKSFTKGLKREDSELESIGELESSLIKRQNGLICPAAGEDKISNKLLDTATNA